MMRTSLLSDMFAVLPTCAIYALTPLCLLSETITIQSAVLRLWVVTEPVACHASNTTRHAAGGPRHPWRPVTIDYIGLKCNRLT